MTTPHIDLLPYQAHQPDIEGPLQAARAGHAIIGRVRLGAGAWLGAGATIRADGNYIQIGAGFQMGRSSTVHISEDMYPTVIGRNVVLGGNVVVHACSLHDEVVVGDDTVILDGSTVESGVVIEAGSIVYPRSVLRAGMLYAGRPAKPKRPLAPGEWQSLALAQTQRNAAASGDWTSLPQARSMGHCSFVAHTAWLEGDVRLADQASVWYGCKLDAGTSRIQIGLGCNVQDNSMLTARSQGIVMGADSTLGHNVLLEDSTVGARCLVGMGSRIAPGTVIGDDTFVAAGSATEPGQHLEGGMFYGGQPARRIGPMDDTKKAIIRATAKVYTVYADALMPRTQP